MKKALVVILILSFFFNSFAYGNNASAVKTVTMMMDGRNVSFNVAQLKVNDNIISTDVPPVIHNNRTLVPLRAVMENLKAEVAWDGAKQEVTVITEGKSIRLRINSSEAIVNGQPTTLPDGVPAKLINNRTMVPIRFVAEAIGLTVGWDEKTRTVSLTDNNVIKDEVIGIENPGGSVGHVEGEILLQDVRVNGTEIRIKLSQEPQYTTTNLVNPTRLVFDLQNTRFQMMDTSQLQANNTLRLPINNSGINELRISQFSNNPMVTRIVLEMTNQQKHNVIFDQSTSELVISFNDMVNYVNNIRLETHNAKEIVIIEGTIVEHYNVMMLQNPRRLVVDIMNATLNSPERSYRLNVDGRSTQSIRVSQFQPDHHYKPDDKIVRVVVDLINEIHNDDIFIEVKGNQLWVHVEGRPFQTMEYQVKDFKTSTLTFRSPALTRFRVTRVENTNLVEVTVPKERIALEFTNLEINDHLINRITVRDDGPLEYLITIELKEDVELNILSPTVNTQSLVLELQNINPFRAILVIIDPGHGGRDPGTISPRLRLRESDLVLDISHRFNNLLLEAGFRTYMTRTDDTFVQLRDRVAAANQLGGDIFISVHANAVAGKPDVHGIETFFYPSEINPEDNRNNRKLAQLFQSTLVERLGAHDRRIKPTDNFVVTRETRMPAILAEVGFLTNATEESRLATDEYRQRIAEAMLEATIKFFEETLRR